MLLWDRDERSYSYYIETSVDQINWNRVIDYTEYYCRSWQILYFTSRAVRYIKVVGTHNTSNRWFQIVALEAYHTAKIPTLVNGLIAPTHNVATPDKGAVVIEGQYRKVLLDGDFSLYDGIQDFTQHSIGNANSYVVDAYLKRKF